MHFNDPFHDSIILESTYTANMDQRDFIKSSKLTNDQFAIIQLRLLIM